MLLCNQTIIEAETGKLSIIGIFDNIEMDRFPGWFPIFTAFLQLTDGIGAYKITIEVWDLQRGEVLASVTSTGIEFDDRADKVNLMIPVPSLLLQHPGRYDVVVLTDGQEIDRQQFVAERPEGEYDDEDDAEEPEEY